MSMRKEIFFLRNHGENEAGNRRLFEKALNEAKATGLQLSFIKTNCIKLYAIDLERCSILTFYFLHHILSMIFQEKCF